MRNIDKLTVSFHGSAVGALMLSPDKKVCVFEYDAKWLESGFSISPLELPLKPGLFIAKPTPFYGNFGIFEDSLPDGYGRYLLHKALLKEGIRYNDLNPIERLSLVGEGGMGALCYTPASPLLQRAEMPDFETLQSKALEVLREYQSDDAAMLLFNSGNSGGARPKAIFSDDSGHWLVKFRHTYDAIDSGICEYRYNKIAEKSGITVPDCRLINGKYFATRRFDISEADERIHIATAGALLALSLDTPVLDYSNLLALTVFLTGDAQDVEELFRRMVFNYLIDNKDDHCKNFSFYVDGDKSGKWRWRLAPAYDLTLSSQGYNGEHATSVNGSGQPKLSDFVYLGEKAGIHRQRCIKIIDQIKDSVGELARYEIL